MLYYIITMENNNIEEFKIIAGFEKYSISNFGNVRNYYNNI